jgi:hypothetical protein
MAKATRKTFWLMLNDVPSLLLLFTPCVCFGWFLIRAKGNKWVAIIISPFSSQVKTTPRK